MATTPNNLQVDGATSPKLLQAHSSPNERYTGSYLKSTEGIKQRFQPAPCPRNADSYPPTSPCRSVIILPHLFPFNKHLGSQRFLALPDHILQCLVEGIHPHIRKLFLPLSPRSQLLGLWIEPRAALEALGFCYTARCGGGAGVGSTVRWGRREAGRVSVSTSRVCRGGREGSCGGGIRSLGWRG